MARIRSRSQSAPPRSCAAGGAVRAAPASWRATARWKKHRNASRAGSRRSAANPASYLRTSATVAGARCALHTLRNAMISALRARSAVADILAAASASRHSGNTTTVVSPSLVLLLVPILAVEAWRTRPVTPAVTPI